MVLPALAAGAAIGIAGGLVQAWQSAKANKANQEEIDELKRMVDAVQKPDFDLSMFSPEQYKLAGTYNPEVAAFVAEKDPTLISGKSADAQAGQNARMAALGNLRGIADGDNSITQQAYRDAAATAAQSAQGTQGQIADSMAKRGLSGNGADLAARLSASQGSAQRGAQLAGGAANAAIQARLQAIRDSGTLGGQINQDANQLETNNAGIINSFNQRFANNQNNYNQYASGIRNDAQGRNLAAQQSIMNNNTGLKNDAAQWNLQNQNNLKSKSFDADISKLNARSGVGAKAIDNTNATAGRDIAVTKGFTDTAGILAGKALEAPAAAAPTTNLTSELDPDLVAKKKMGYA